MGAVVDQNVFLSDWQFHTLLRPWAWGHLQALFVQPSQCMPPAPLPTGHYLHTTAPARAQEPAVFCRGTSGWSLRTAMSSSASRAPGGGGCTKPLPQPLPQPLPMTVPPHPLVQATQKSHSNTQKSHIKGDSLHCARTARYF